MFWEAPTQLLIQNVTYSAECYGSSVASMSDSASGGRQIDPTMEKLNFLFIPNHGLSQQGVWVPLWTLKPLKRTPQDTQIF